MHRHELTDEQWKQLEPLIPARRGPRTKKGDRQFVNAVLWRVKTGAPWRDLPERYGPWKTVYNRFGRWATRGVWEGLFKSLQLQVDDVGSLMDATIIRAHHEPGPAVSSGERTTWVLTMAPCLTGGTGCEAEGKQQG
ncbi:IS5 family transposase [Corallococcus exiguus]|uniref:IS5 family transposase n=1 Tax=Corallococcus exiguus TaxID=83462 RepID=UPI001471944D|nr:IS5 family transposase [Corallococcus exiguus]